MSFSVIYLIWLQSHVIYNLGIVVYVYVILKLMISRFFWNYISAYRPALILLD